MGKELIDDTTMGKESKISERRDGVENNGRVCRGIQLRPGGLDIHIFEHSDSSEIFITSPFNHHPPILGALHFDKH